MKRTNISLTDEQHNWLYERAHKAKIGMAQLVRIMIDESMSQGSEITYDKPVNKSFVKKNTFVKSHRTDEDNLGGGPNFSPQPKVGKKKK